MGAWRLFGASLELERGVSRKLAILRFKVGLCIAICTHPCCFKLVYSVHCHGEAHWIVVEV
jgi:hypothetical protein